ncbi:PPOX class probable F420-dependent enzyme [Streptomyces sp. SAI-208]|nr:PPOX class probable F420-dependent enzyme [Streptomyces sp. SAI-208]
MYEVNGKVEGHIRERLPAPDSWRLATAGPDGAPQVSPVRADLEGEYVMVNTAIGRVKEENLRRNPNVSLSHLDPYDRVEIRGRVVRFVEGEEAERSMDRLTRKYIGEERCPWLLAGERRVMLLIEPVRVRRVMGVEPFRPGTVRQDWTRLSTPWGAIPPTRRIRARVASVGRLPGREVSAVFLGARVRSMGGGRQLPTGPLPVAGPGPGDELGRPSAGVEGTGAVGRRPGVTVPARRELSAGHLLAAGLPVTGACPGEIGRRSAGVGAASVDRRRGGRELSAGSLPGGRAPAIGRAPGEIGRRSAGVGTASVDRRRGGRELSAGSLSVAGPGRRSVGRRAERGWSCRRVRARRPVQGGEPEFRHPLTAPPSAKPPPRRRAIRT